MKFSPATPNRPAAEDKGRAVLVFELGSLPATPTPEDYLPAENAKLPQIAFFDWQVLERRGRGLLADE